MSPKKARIQLARPTSVFSAKREAKGKGMAGAGAASPWTRGTGWDGTGVPAAGAGEALPLTRSGPQLPAAPSSSPSPLRHFCFIYEYVAGIQMSLSILWPPHFPTEGQCLPDAGSGRNSARRKGKSERMLFSSFLFLPPPPPNPPYFILRVCQAHSSLDVPLSLPSSPFILLALL